MGLMLARALSPLGIQQTHLSQTFLPPVIPRSLSFTGFLGAGDSLSYGLKARALLSTKISAARDDRMLLMSSVESGEVTGRRPGLQRVPGVQLSGYFMCSSDAGVTQADPAIMGAHGRHNICFLCEKE